jgi:hypothetical protein
MVQRPRQRHNNTNQHSDDRKYHSAKRVVGKSIQNLSAGEDVESNEKDVVSEQHEAAEFVGKTVLSENAVSKIACAKIR